VRPKIALHSFIVEAEPELDDDAWAELGERLREMVATGEAPSAPIEPLRKVIVEVNGGEGGRSVVRVIAPDELGLLSSICRFFQAEGLNIETLRAQADEGVAKATFVICGDANQDVLIPNLKRWLADPPT
jgi:hypothetical protein